MAYTAVYAGSDLGTMSIDIVGGVLNGLAQNATLIGSLIAIVVVIIIVVDLLTGVFGIFKFLRKGAR